MENYYVYEWIRLDTNEPFYVGKGHGNRCYQLTRKGNKHFNNIVKSISCVVNILHDDLDEQTAYGLECYYIWLYRDIIGYNLVNMNDGGEGQTLCGKSNPFYGKHHTEETKEKIRQYRRDNPYSEEMIEKLRISATGENNYWYGKKRPEHAEKMKDKFVGENNPMYGKYGKENPTSKSVICITMMTVFYGMREAARYYGIKSPSRIGVVCRGDSKFCGKLPDGTPLVWKYLTIVPL